MKNLKIDETKYTPEMTFDPETLVIAIKGKSYPENTEEFYKPAFEWLEKNLSDLGKKGLTVNLELIYFNSSSSKALMNFFDMLEESVDNGDNITVNWMYEEDNESILEYGEEFLEDIETLPFNLVPLKSRE